MSDEWQTSSLDPLKSVGFNDVSSDVRVPSLDAHRLLRLLRVQEGRRHQVLALVVELRDPADIGAKQLQRVQRRLHLLVLLAHEVLVRPVLNVDSDYRAPVFCSDVAAGDLDFWRGANYCWEGHIILVVVSLTFQGGQFKIDVGNGLEQYFWFLLWVSQCNFGYR